MVLPVLPWAHIEMSVNIDYTEISFMPTAYAGRAGVRDIVAASEQDQGLAGACEFGDRRARNVVHLLERCLRYVAYVHDRETIDVLAKLRSSEWRHAGQRSANGRWRRTRSRPATIADNAFVRRHAEDDNIGALKIRLFGN
jgi:hypothetical protein